ncbi:MAG TPA: phosphotransferase family protein [Candidatus Acidoferrum sp.]|jgi:aminoglycoside phosphotransferase (APT) family kinase protein|nr:phosphotransferase family protein [Candidatus Acidoferrum sp.]
MTERIRADLEAECRKRLRRPRLRVLSVDAIPEGHSGFTYFVTIDDGDGPRRFVLRLPPPGARIAGPADVVRQGRIMAALHKEGLPVPAIPVLVSDPVVDGRPFVLMEAVDGQRIEKAGIEQKPIDIASSAVHVLKRLHALPLAQTGIGEESSVGLNAEMLRWLWLMERAPQELTGRAGQLGGLLAARVPEARPPTLVHGDFHYGNMLFRGPEVVAVLDWEIAQIGQPLLDLGCLGIVSHRRRYEGAPNPGGSIDVAIEDLYRLYGADASEMRWYQAMSLYKYAAIFGYNLMLHRRGKRPDPMYEGLTDTITGMINEGIALLEPSALEKQR